MHFNFRLVSAASLALATMSLAACGGDDEDPPPPAATTLYERLGKNAGIATAVDAIVAAELQDPEIAAYFALAAQFEGAPSAVQIKECLVLQLGAASGGPEVYPGKVSGDFQCRSMAEAHAHLGISTASFDKFVMIAANTLMSAGVAAADITTIGGVLNSTKGDIAKGPNLYARLGKKAGIATAVDAIVAAEVQDPTIAAFFTPATMAGHTPSVTQIKECLVLQLGAAAGGPEKYPDTVSGGFTCRSMAAAHAGLGISPAVFDNFVMIAANTLMTAGVAADDIATIGAVLNSTKDDVTE